MSCVRFPPDVALCIQVIEFNFHLIKPQTIVRRALSLSRSFLKTPGALSCAFFSGVASVWPLSLKAEICEVLQRLVFPAGSPISVKELCRSVRVVIGFLVTSLTKVLLASCSVCWDGQLQE